MKLQFDAQQDYQLDIIQAVEALFAGQSDVLQTDMVRWGATMPKTNLDPDCCGAVIRFTCL